METNPYGANSPVISEKRMYDSTFHLNLNFQPKVLSRKNKQHLMLNNDSATGIDGSFGSGKIEEPSADQQDSTIQSRLRYKYYEQNANKVLIGGDFTIFNQNEIIQSDSLK